MYGINYCQFTLLFFMKLCSILIQSIKFDVLCTQFSLFLGRVSTKVFFTLFALLGLFICFFGHRFWKTGILSNIVAIYMPCGLFSEMLLGNL